MGIFLPQKANKYCQIRNIAQLLNRCAPVCGRWYLKNDLTASLSSFVKLARFGAKAVGWILLLLGTAPLALRIESGGACLSFFLTRGYLFDKIKNGDNTNCRVSLADGERGVAVCLDVGAHRAHTDCVYEALRAAAIFRVSVCRPAIPKPSLCQPKQEKFYEALDRNMRI